MNVYEKIARLTELKNKYRSALPELDDKASYYYSREDESNFHDAWLIVQTQYQITAEITEQMEEILSGH